MHALNTPITTLAQAEAWAAAAPELASLPSFEQYKAGLETFLRESAEWCDIDPAHPFHSVNRYGYYESCDNANGGLDVSWAFNLAREDPSGYRWSRTEEEGVRRALTAVEANYIRLCEEDRLLMEENADEC